MFSGEKRVKFNLSAERSDVWTGRKRQTARETHRKGSREVYLRLWDGTEGRAVSRRALGVVGYVFSLVSLFLFSLYFK